MPYQIRRAAVLGAGVMGAAIAAHLANAGIPSLLLDIVPPDAAKDRDKIARMGLEKAINARPAAFYSKKAARLVTVGNIEDDLEELAADRGTQRGLQAQFPDHPLLQPGALHAAAGTCS